MSLFTLYLLTRFTSFGNYLTFLAIISYAFALVSFFCYLANADSYGLSEADKKIAKNKCFKWLKGMIVIGTIFGFLSSAMPSNRDAYMIVGGYYATNYIISSTAAKQLPDNILNATNTFLKEYAGDISKQVKEVTKDAIKGN